MTFVMDVAYLLLTVLTLGVMLAMLGILRSQGVRLDRITDTFTAARHGLHRHDGNQPWSPFIPHGCSCEWAARLNGGYLLVHYGETCALHIEESD